MSFVLWIVLLCAGKPEFFEGCPVIELRGKMVEYAFPGPPNYSSVEEGDTSEVRWALYLDDEEIERLVMEDKLTQADVNTSYWKRLIQLIGGYRFRSLAGREVVVKGYMGELITHGHTPFQVEVMDVYGAD